MVKVGQNQHLRLIPQRHIFYIVFFDKNIVSPTRQIPGRKKNQKNSLSPRDIHFFLIPSFSKCGTESCPPNRKSRWGKEFAGTVATFTWVWLFSTSNDNHKIQNWITLIQYLLLHDLWNCSVHHSNHRIHIKGCVSGCLLKCYLILHF